jgi:hypothetical protein
MLKCLTPKYFNIFAKISAEPAPFLLDLNDILVCRQKKNCFQLAALAE